MARSMGRCCWRLDNYFLLISLTASLNSAEFGPVSTIELEIGEARLEIGFDDSMDMQAQATEVYNIVRARVGRLPSGLGCIDGDMRCFERSLTIAFHRASRASQYQARLTAFEANVALSWCSGQGHGPVGLQEVPAVERVVGWMDSDEVYNERERRSNSLDPHLQSRCQYDFQIMVDYWFETPNIPYATQWLRILDMLSMFGLDHVGEVNSFRRRGTSEFLGNESRCARVHGENVASNPCSVVSQFLPEAPPQPISPCRGRGCRLSAVCFDGASWVLPCRRHETVAWAASRRNLTGFQHLVPARFLLMRETSPSFSRRLLTTDFFNFVSTAPNGRGERGAVMIGLVANHIAHAAELMFAAFAEGWARFQHENDQGGTPEHGGSTPEALPFAALVLPGVGSFNCLWCVDLANALHAGAPGIVQVHFEDTLLRQDAPVCFSDAMMIYEHLDCSGRDTERGCSWFGSEAAARAFQVSVFQSFTPETNPVPPGGQPHRFQGPAGPRVGEIVGGCSWQPVVVVVDRLCGTRRLANGSKLRDQLAVELEGLAVVEPVTFLEAPTVRVPLSLFLREEPLASSLTHAPAALTLPTAVIPSHRNATVAARKLCVELLLAVNASEPSALDFVDAVRHDTCPRTLLIAIEEHILFLRAQVAAENSLAPTLIDQINLFSKASVVVAAHGAALVNIAFMQQNSTVIEILPHGIADGTAESIRNGSDPAEVMSGVPDYFGALAHEVGVRRVLLADPSPNQQGCRPPFCALGVPTVGYNLAEVIMTAKEALLGLSCNVAS